MHPILAALSNSFFFYPRPQSLSHFPLSHHLHPLNRILLLGHAHPIALTAVGLLCLCRFQCLHKQRQRNRGDIYSGFSFSQRTAQTGTEANDFHFMRINNWTWQLLSLYFPNQVVEFILGKEIIFALDYITALFTHQRTNGNKVAMGLNFPFMKPTTQQMDFKKKILARNCRQAVNSSLFKIRSQADRGNKVMKHAGQSCSLLGRWFLCSLRLGCMHTLWDRCLM